MAKYFTITCLVIICMAGFVGGAKLNEWERLNAYPYGKLCDLYRNCK